MTVIYNFMSTMVKLKQPNKYDDYSCILLYDISQILHCGFHRHAEKSFSRCKSNSGWLKLNWVMDIASLGKDH
jgi:hypothetical protein